MDERLLLVRQLLSEGDVAGAEGEARKIEDPYWRSYALRWVAEALADEPERALEVALSIEEPSVRDEALRSLAYIFSKNEKFKEALETARKIGNSFLRKKAFRAVSNFLARAIATKGVEIRLSDLKLDERDLEDLKPLPYGIIYKDGKLMPGSVLHRIKGEVMSGVVDRSAEGPKREPPKPVFESEESEPEDYVFEYIRKLIEEGELEEAEKLAKGLPEPFRSFYLEEIGVRLLETGDTARAEEIFRELEVSDVLGSLLARKNLDKPELVLKYLEKTHNPATRLMVAYEVTKERGVDTEFLRNALIWATDEWKRGRILKFLAFEMLEEAKEKGDERLRRISRELFELGKSVENSSEN
ncbi:hypothetical protein [Thermococcus sp. 21S9]|uniref:hypothetical protein n=1 Tax=Thermococcus sp. 21S9 TaxID=1638223 RepID=UPI001439C554|nr:hypothetical protein [Thermococcus sp. 21S9]NJE54872.1 hypothetical protein [Thermococcus sp. 21S9]